MFHWSEMQILFSSNHNRRIEDWPDTSLSIPQHGTTPRPLLARERGGPKIKSTFLLRSGRNRNKLPPIRLSRKNCTNPSFLHKFHASRIIHAATSTFISITEAGNLVCFCHRSGCWLVHLSLLWVTVGWSMACSRNLWISCLSPVPQWTHDQPTLNGVFDKIVRINEAKYFVGHWVCEHERRRGGVFIQCSVVLCRWWWLLEWCMKISRQHVRFRMKFYIALWLPENWMAGCQRSGNISFSFKRSRNFTPSLYFQ